MHRVSVVVGSEAGKVDVYLLDEISSDPSNLNKMRPLASIVDLAIGREAVVDFAPRKARYVMLRWTAKSDRRPLVVAEVSAFSTGVSDPSPVALTASDAPEGPPLIASVSP